MRHRPRAAIALLLLATGMATNALLGPLGLDRIAFHVSRSATLQLIGGEIVALVIAVPLALAAAILWLRGRWIGPVLALGPAGYALYLYVQYVIGPQYDRYPGNNEYYFPLYLTLILLAGGIVNRAWRGLSRMAVPSPTAGVRRALALVLLALNLTLALAWSASIAAILSGSDSVAYSEDPSLFWIVRLMDLSVVIPLAIIAGVGLARQTMWAARLALAIVGPQLLLAAAVTSMACVMLAHGDPSASWTFAGFSALGTFALASLYVTWLRQLTRVAPSPRAFAPSREAHAV